jgi:putative Mg2+ transporter-C (MgtC) family protein
MFSAILADISGNWENILKLVLASICGGLIGFERSLRHKDAGIRTHIILCMGTALFVIVSRYGFNRLIRKCKLGCDKNSSQYSDRHRLFRRRSLFF